MKDPDTDARRALVRFLRFLHENGYRELRLLGGGRWAGLFAFGYTVAIILGRVGDCTGYDDRWCYHDATAARVALEAWDGTGEPAGWHRHPGTGRRVAETDHDYDGDDNLVPRGALYVRR